VRELVHAADPDVTETIKRTNRPYFVLNGNICALLGANDHVNILNVVKKSGKITARQVLLPVCSP